MTTPTLKAPLFVPPPPSVRASGSCWPTHRHRARERRRTLNALRRRERQP